MNIFHMKNCTRNRLILLKGRKFCFSESEDGNFYRFEDMEESYFIYLNTKACGHSRTT